MAYNTSTLLMRFLPFLGYHHIIMIFLIFGTILLSIVVAGCTTSNNLQNVYILSLFYVPTPNIPTMSSPVQLNSNITSTFATIAATHSALQVRVSYLGICISQVHSQWMCSNNALTLSNLIKLYGGVESGEQDPLNLIWIAGRFKDEMLYSGLLLTSIALAFVAILLLSTFPSWYESDDDAPEVEGDSRPVPKPFPSRPVMKIALGSLVISALFCFISVLLQHVASAAGSAMVEALSYGTIHGKVGPAAMVLGWAGELLYLISAAGVLVVTLAYRASMGT
ncbi:Ca2+ regulator and membrane fusion protein Fig1-domain-containing protein [Leptodontidium sp. MPI-SDFR-AT-0119]|nr:Ca2+ regulator and membrane fusion protein Fig1-domain-containing protein [Leptodontidium sp. MPI-SDFR-AT-0119]